jgi:hypothetical protein
MRARCIHNYLASKCTRCLPGALPPLPPIPAPRNTLPLGNRRPPAPSPAARVMFEQLEQQIAGLTGKERVQ